MSESLVRKAIASDCAQLAGLLTSHEDDRSTQSTNAKLIAEAALACIGTPDHEVYVVETGDKIVGYIAVHWIPFPMLHGREGYISDLLVAADWRGCGFGHHLLRAVEDRARELGCVRLMLNNITSTESFARKFYSKLGFRHRTEVANFVKPLDEKAG